MDSVSLADSHESNIVKVSARGTLLQINIENCVFCSEIDGVAHCRVEYWIT